MKALLDSFWRAAAYCLHPRVIALSLLPLVLMAGLALGLGYFFWEPALDAVRATFESWELVGKLLAWLEGVGLAGLKTVLAPMVVVFLSTPVIVVLALLLVATLMAPSMLSLVAERRFPALERKHGGSFFGSAFGALWATLAALLALLVSIPFWLVPPLVLVLPPLIWGWLTYRVMTYDVLAEHASREERRELVRRHRGTLLGMGVLTGYLGAAPSLVWASGAFALVLAPLVVVFLTTPVIVVLSLLLVAAFMTPSMLKLVATRRFGLLERKRGGSFFGSLFGALWATLAALVALIVSVPLWLVPPLVLILPPLIWGWLTYRVMTYDVLAEHASRTERRELVRRHRASLLGIGVVTGYLGAAPSLVWASGALAIVFAPVLVPVAVWIYTLVFAFSALWFSHYALAALQALRGEGAAIEILPPVPGGARGAVLIDDATPIALPPAAAGAPPHFPSERP